MANYEYEYETPSQHNVGFGGTLSMTKKAPAIAKRIFDTYEHAIAFINNKRDTAIAGIVLSVFKDTTPSYQLVKSNIDKAEKERLISESGGGYQEVDKLPTKEMEGIGDNLIMINEDNVTYSSFKKVIGAKNGLYQVLEDPLNQGSLKLKKVADIGLGYGIEEDNLGRPSIKIESTILSTTDADGKLIKNEMLTVSDQGLRFNIVTDMGMYNPDSLKPGSTPIQYFKDSLQIFRNQIPFLPNKSENLTALQNAKTYLNKLFTKEFMESAGNSNTARIKNSSFAFKDGEPIAVYYKEDDGIVRIALAIVYVNFDPDPQLASKTPVSLSWFSNDDEKQGGEGKTYNAGEGIKLDNVTNTFSTDSSIINLGEMSNDEDLKGSIIVTNPIGNFKLKEEVTIDTAMKRIVKDMLTKLEDVETELPSTSFDFYSKDTQNVYQEGIYEVGTYFGGNLKYKYPVENQGKFKGWWLEPNGYKYAECAKNETSKYSFGDELTLEPITSNIEDASIQFNINEGTSTIALDLHYNASPYNDTILQNDGKTNIDESSKIFDGQIPTITKTYIGQYKYFIGTFTQKNVGDVIIESANQLLELSNLEIGFCTVEGTTSISKIASTTETPTIVLAVPSKYKNITKTCNDFGQEIDLSTNKLWIPQKDTISYTNGDKTTEYTIYIQYLTDGTIYRNIEFGV